MSANYLDMTVHIITGNCACQPRAESKESIKHNVSYRQNNPEFLIMLNARSQSVNGPAYYQVSIHPKSRPGPREQTAFSEKYVPGVIMHSPSQSYGTLKCDPGPSTICHQLLLGQFTQTKLTCNTKRDL